MEMYTFVVPAIKMYTRDIQKVDKSDQNGLQNKRCKVLLTNVISKIITNFKYDVVAVVLTSKVYKMSGF